ncbi:MAG: aspartate--tRNA ligase [Candidatus Woesearchaeota archaeon]
MKTSLRTHTCGELNSKNTDNEVKLSGWVDTRRDHGGVIFIDLRDRYGITQIVFNPEFNKEVHASADQLRREDTICVKGIVKSRAEGMANPRLKTGEIEVFISELEILNKSETPPIEVDDKKIANEDMRLKYRYLDLRRPSMQGYFQIRHEAAMAARESLCKQGFIEIETPLLMKATPEGARDYVVPSRVNPGKFYALPQSPQLYKQLLMVSGFDRYFQLAKCLRDEDLRADRQPEFTQIDAEMSFVEQDDVFTACENMIKHILKKTKNINLEIPFLRCSYKDVMDKYGCDKPDLRFALELTEVTEIVVKSDFSVFKDVQKNGGIVKCINPEKDLGRKDIDGYITFCQENGAKGMAWMRVTESGLDSNIAKYFPENVQKELIEKTKAKPGSILMFIADKENKCNEILSKLRNKLGEDLGLYSNNNQGNNNYKFLWVLDFPLFEKDEESGKWLPAHHMFTMPKKECLQYLEKDNFHPEKVYATCYDLVLNGVELASGSIRVHRPDIQQKIMDIVGFPKEKAEERFGFLLEAFKFGAPPHGGFGLGFDRLVAMLCGFNDIRDVIAFPKNKSAQCPMDGSPSSVEPEQLKELHIKTDIPK